MSFRAVLFFKIRFIEKAISVMLHVMLKSSPQEKLRLLLNQQFSVFGQDAFPNLLTLHIDTIIKASPAGLLIIPKKSNNRLNAVAQIEMEMIIGENTPRFSIPASELINTTKTPQWELNATRADVITTIFLHSSFNIWLFFCRQQNREYIEENNIDVVFYITEPRSRSCIEQRSRTEATAPLFDERHI